MPYENTFNAAANTPIRLTLGGATASCRLQNVGDEAFWVQAAASDSVAPDFSGAILVPVRTGGWDASADLSKLFPSRVASGATTHLWALGAEGLSAAISYA